MVVKGRESQLLRKLRQKSQVQDLPELQIEFKDNFGHLGSAGLKTNKQTKTADLVK